MQKSQASIGILAFVGGLLLTNSAHSEIINVPADQPTIQAGIDAASNGDEVIVAPGTYLETINLLGKAVTLRSSDGPEVTMIDAENAGTVVTCASGEGVATVIEGFTITAGSSNAGSGMFIENSSPTVTNCAFVDNTASEFGGGVYANNAAPHFTDCAFISRHGERERSPSGIVT